MYYVLLCFDSECSKECIGFNMMCVFLLIYQYAITVTSSKNSLIFKTGDSFDRFMESQGTLKGNKIRQTDLKSYNKKIYAKIKKTNYGKRVFDIVDLVLLPLLYIMIEIISNLNIKINIVLKLVSCMSDMNNLLNFENCHFLL